MTEKLILLLDSSRTPHKRTVALSCHNLMCFLCYGCETQSGSYLNISFLFHRSQLCLVLLRWILNREVKRDICLFFTQIILCFIYGHLAPQIIVILDLRVKAHFNTHVKECFILPAPTTKTYWSADREFSFMNEWFSVIKRWWLFCLQMADNPEDRHKRACQSLSDSSDITIDGLTQRLKLLASDFDIVSVWRWVTASSSHSLSVFNNIRGHCGKVLLGNTKETWSIHLSGYNDKIICDCIHYCYWEQDRNCSEDFPNRIIYNTAFPIDDIDDIEHSVGVKDKCDITQYERLTSDVCRRWWIRLTELDTSQRKMLLLRSCSLISQSSYMFHRLILRSVR